MPAALLLNEDDSDEETSDVRPPTTRSRSLPFSRPSTSGSGCHTPLNRRRKPYEPYVNRASVGTVRYMRPVLAPGQASRLSRGARGGSLGGMPCSTFAASLPRAESAPELPRPFTPEAAAQRRPGTASFSPAGCDRSQIASAMPITDYNFLRPGFHIIGR